VPIFTIILSIIFFHEIFTLNQWLAVSYLILGTMVISAISTRHSVWYEVKKFLHVHFEKRWHSILFSFISALFFALFWFGSKVAYNSQEFLSAFIWIRLGSFVAVVCLLISPHNRAEIARDLKKSKGKKQNKFIFIGTQLGGALGSILQNYAVALGSVALVTSLQGLQYGLILAFTYFITIFYPKIIKEKQSRKIMLYKVVASLLVALGLFYMSK
jgi:drug/metabolite transporter (DMT)-like permease